MSDYDVTVMPSFGYWRDNWKPIRWLFK